ncbi:MAG TPA: FtsX-like permease family protein [Actinophytocola sp.]|uniref:FtsX-like permease family protein n=1 Tax=Actinophytocola sp. TaxID=1872138 RepID=UPI002DDCE4BC|nr:FtsX-like permease family protein [Actinophytocola sp.]HEV2782406.1 FtsX-like permease family protein [Actinophytocola sp.]
MLRIALRTMRFRKGGFAATFIALFFGAALVMACGGLLETGVRTDVAPQRYAATDVVVTGDQTYAPPPTDPEDDAESEPLPERVRLDASVVGTIRGVPGVALAEGDVSFPVGLVRAGRVVDSAPLGHSWASGRLAPYTLGAGAQPGPGEVVLDRTMAGANAIAVGDRVDLLARGTTGTFRVSGIAEPPAAVTGTPAVFFAGADADRLAARPGSVDAVGVLAAPGVDAGQLAERIGAALRGQPVTISTGNDRGTAEFPEAPRGSEGLIALAGVIGGFAILVAIFVVAGTLGLSIQHRHRELALLRAIGTTPRQLRRMVLTEAFTVAVLATALACVPGVLLGGWILDRLAGLGAVPALVVFHQGWLPMIVGTGVGLLTSLVAGLMAARRAGRTRPVEALSDAATQRRWLGPMRLLFAVLGFAGGLALAIVTVTVFDGSIAASTAGPTVMVWAVALAMIAPGLTKVVGALLRPVLRGVGGNAGYLAMLNAKARTVRLAAAVTPIMFSVGIATAMIYLQTTLADAEREAYTRNLRADVVLASTTGGLPTDLVDQVRRVPGVAGASEFVTSTGFVDGDTESVPLQGVSADGAEQTTSIRLTGGTLADLRGDGVAVPAELGVSVGDSMRIRLGDGASVPLRVVALFAGDPGYPRILLPAELLVSHTTNGLPAQIMVRAGAGVDPAALRAALRELTADRPGVAVADRDAMTAAYVRELQVGASVNYLLVGLIMMYTAISVVNTLVMATSRRRRELGLQRLTGSTRGQVLRMMTLEAILVAAVGILLGTLVSTTTLVPFSLAATDSVWPSGPLWIYGAVVGVATVLTVAATLLPAWFATRGRPAEAAAGPE